MASTTAAPRKSLFSSLASTADHQQLPAALVEWVHAQPAGGGTASLRIEDGTSGLDELKDGVRLAEIVAQIDPDYFSSLIGENGGTSANALSDNWILRFNYLKKLYRLIVRYFEEILRASTANLLTPNLRLVAKHDPRESDDEVCKLIGLVLALTVQSPKKQEHIARIQKLDEWVQRELMYSIEQVMSKVRPVEILEEVEAEEAANNDDDEADDFYTIRHEKSRIMHDKEALQILYGDHLYAKADYEGAMSAYLKTVGSVQPSYVIRKFLDAQRLTHLTSYLQELHSKGLANSDITTLLLNCYTKLKDDEAISRFIHSSASDRDEDVPPFDLETAIRVLRQAGYFTHAGWLAERYHAHGEYLRIAIEDTNDFAGALNYVRQLARGQVGGDGGRDGRDEAEESMKRWGGVLLAHEPDLTTDVLVEICCGAEVDEERIRASKFDPSSGAAARKSSTNGGYDVPDDAASTAIPTTTAITTEPTSSPLPSPRAFFAHFVDHPHQFIVFLEQVLQRRFGKSVDALVPPSSLTGTEAPLPAVADLAEPSDVRQGATRDEQVLWNTLLELYISAAAAARGGDDHGGNFEARAIKLLRCRDQVPYDETQALLVCTTSGFEEGFVLLYELLGMYEEIVQYWIEASEAEPTQASLSSRIIRSLRRYGPACPSLYRLVLSHLTSSSELLSRHQADVVEILDEIDERRIMPAIQVVQLLSKNNTASLGLVREYLKRQLLADKEDTESDQALIASYRAETAKKRKEIQELSDPNAPRIFQVTRCSACQGQLDLPAVHFMCKHSYHQRCLGENESQCPNCARTHGVIREIRSNNEQLAGQHDTFVQEMAESDDPFATVANAFSRGWLAYDGPDQRSGPVAV